MSKRTQRETPPSPRRVVKSANRRRAPMVRRGLAAQFHTLALEPAMDAAKLEQLIAADERRQSRDAARAFAVDFAGMAGELPVIDERGEIRFADQVVGTYALWEDLNEAIRPVLQRWGFALTLRWRARARRSRSALPCCIAQDTRSPPA